MNGTLPALQPGDTVALVAPAGPFDEQGLSMGRALLERTYRVRARPDIGTRAGFLAGDDPRRAEELLAAVRDPDVRGIVAVRGGYGTTRILSQVDAEVIDNLTRDPKLLVGFSDITALHALWARAGVGSLHGSMAARIATLPPTLQARWLRALAGQMTERAAGLTSLADGTASGPLLGGNLAVLCALLGTRHMPALTGCVLFLEDVGERPYRVDRMLTSLVDAEVLPSVAAIVLGQFSDCQPGPDGTTVDQVLRERLSHLRVPVVMGLPAGHIADNLELPLGRTVTVDASRGELDLR